jgi:hypothetical protein
MPLSRSERIVKQAREKAASNAFVRQLCILKCLSVNFLRCNKFVDEERRSPADAPARVSEAGDESRCFLRGAIRRVDQSPTACCE